MLLERHLERVRKIQVKMSLKRNRGKCVVWRAGKDSVVNKQGESWDFSLSW